VERSIIEAVTGTDVTVLVALLAANLVLSVLASLVKGTFTLRKVADFIPNRLVPLVGYLVIASLADLVGGWAAVAAATYAGLVALYSAGILAAIKSITGMKLPDVITEKDKAPRG
jgi:hypothetical protein